MERPRGWDRPMPIGRYWRSAIVLFFNYGATDCILGARKRVRKRVPVLPKAICRRPVATGDVIIAGSFGGSDVVAAESPKSIPADRDTLGRKRGIFRWRSRTGFLESQAGASNCLPVEKNRRFPDFLTPALPLASGGGGDRRRLRLGSTELCSENKVGFSTRLRSRDEITRQYRGLCPCLRRQWQEVQPLLNSDRHLADEREGLSPPV
jgi:hypothetical protein